MKIGWIGLGKLGLVCAMTGEHHGNYDVVGYDPSPLVDEILATKRLPYREEGAEELLQKTKIRNISVKNVVAHSDLVFLAVQTPHDPLYEGTTRIPETRVDFDYSYLVKACAEVNAAANELGKVTHLVIISTVIPGTIDREIRPLLGSNIKLGYSPLFIAMGTCRKDYENPELVLFGVDNEETYELALKYFKPIHKAPIYRCSIKSAELSKVAYNCYSEDTEVLTSGGWKLFPHVLPEEEVFSLNPDTLVPEWVKPDRIVGRHHTGPMIHFQSRKDDLLITPEHNMFVGMVSSKPFGNKKYSHVWSLLQAKEVVKRNSFAFIRSTHWFGSSPEFIDLGFGRIPTRVYVEFMAWFLAEGCVSKLSENSNQIVVSQSKDKNQTKYSRIVRNIQELQTALESKNGICQGKQNITFYHKNLGDYLLQFGKSFDKFIPANIKSLGCAEIGLFLDVYNEADGSKKERTRFNGEPTGKFDRYYASSSDQMSADLGEMIIKNGHFPSYRTTESVLSNKPCNLVYELTGKTSVFQRSSKVGLKYQEVPDYEGMIYCAMLPKNHVFLTRRNGKCTWQGNTFISTKIAFVNHLMEVCHHTGADVDEVTNVIKMSTDRLISAKYLTAGMGDGGSCFLPNEIIMTQDGPREISQITPRVDKVISSDGRLHSVLETYKRPFKGYAIKVKARGLPPVTVTPDHPFMAAMDLRKKYVTGGVTKTVNSSGMNPRDFISKAERTIAAELTNDSYLVVPKILEDTIQAPEHATDAYVQLAGYYLSEGCVSGPKRKNGTTCYSKVAFTMHTQEQDYLQEIEQLIKVVQPQANPKRYKRPISLAEDVIVNNAQLARCLKSDFSHLAWNKVIPSWILFGEEKHAKNILRGMWRGDGSSNSEGFNFSTTSRHLAYGMFVLLNRFDIVSNITYHQSRIGKNDGVQHREAWEVRVRNAGYIEKLAALVGMNIRHPMQEKKYMNTIPVRDGFSLHKVDSLELVEYEGTVWNMNIEETHDYLSPAGISQNCHPRDNIALSWLARKIGMTFDLPEAIMMAREKQTDFLADLIQKNRQVVVHEDFTFKEQKTLLPVVILGKAFKEQTNLVTGSPSILLKSILEERGIVAEMYDPWVDAVEDKTVNPYSTEPACFFIGTRHAEFAGYKFPVGSVVIDPWRMIKDQPGVRVIRVGQSK